MKWCFFLERASLEAARFQEQVLTNMYTNVKKNRSRKEELGTGYLPIEWSISLQNFPCSPERYFCWLPTDEKSEIRWKRWQTCCSTCSGYLRGQYCQFRGRNWDCDEERCCQMPQRVAGVDVRKRRWNSERRSTKQIRVVALKCLDGVGAL